MATMVSHSILRPQVHRCLRPRIPIQLILEYQDSHQKTSTRWITNRSQSTRWYLTEHSGNDHLNQLEPDHLYHEADDCSRRSRSAEFGTTRRGSITLPQDLVEGVNEVVQSVTNRSTIRTSALGLYGKYRLTSSKKSLDSTNEDLMTSTLQSRKLEGLEKTVKPKLKTTYDHLTSISFAAGAMPSVYGATLKVFFETKRRLEAEIARSGAEKQAWVPTTLLDYGSGTGSAAWAAIEVWPETLKEYAGIDKSSSMIWLSEKLLSGRVKHDAAGNPLPTSDLKTGFKRITISPTKAQRAREQAVVDTALLAQLEQDQAELVSPSSIYCWTGETSGLLSVMAFTLSDLPNHVSRREAVLGLWNTGAETMIIIDRGTPAGFQVVADAREQLLMLGRREARRPPSEFGVNDASVLTAEDTKPDTSVDVESPAGSWVLAPCPHDQACPLHVSNNPKHFCHFSQRIDRPKFLKDTKHTAKHSEDAKFSYVVIRRGQRRVPSESDQKSTSERHIEKITIPRSQGKQEYYDARKAFWGDSWPHGSKKPGLVKDLGSSSVASAQKRSPDCQGKDNQD